MPLAKSKSLVVVGLVLASACANSGRTPTLSSADVIGTAQAIAALTASRRASAILFTETPTVHRRRRTDGPLTPNFAAAAKYNVSVRSGPGEAYPIVDLFLQGQTAQIVGRYDDPDFGTWWLVVRIGQGINGWVWSGAADVAGDTSLVPVLEAPEVPDD
jgi:SH3-like domain-containing protein